MSDIEQKTRDLSFPKPIFQRLKAGFLQNELFTHIGDHDEVDIVFDYHNTDKFLQIFDKTVMDLSLNTPTTWLLEMCQEMASEDEKAYDMDDWDPVQLTTFVLGKLLEVRYQQLYDTMTAHRAFPIQRLFKDKPLPDKDQLNEEKSYHPKFDFGVRLMDRPKLKQTTTLIEGIAINQKDYTGEHKADYYSTVDADGVIFTLIDLTIKDKKNDIKIQLGIRNDVLRNFLKMDGEAPGLSFITPIPSPETAV